MGYDDEDVIADGWEQPSYIPLVGDIVNCFDGINVEVLERELRYDDNQHLTVILHCVLDKDVCLRGLHFQRIEGCLPRVVRNATTQSVTSFSIVSNDRERGLQRRGGCSRRFAAIPGASVAAVGAQHQRSVWPSQP